MIVFSKFNFIVNSGPHSTVMKKNKRVKDENPDQFQLDININKFAIEDDLLQATVPRQ